tara:strand:+ start:429 stop:1307 length:879 start_codon:yes stop_codon:yes gene_type:complete
MSRNLNIIVTGASGQLGSSFKYLANKYKYKFHFYDKTHFDITDYFDVEKKIKKILPKIIINCAAYTDVDKSELNKRKANLINNLAVKNLAEKCYKYKIKLIHISTDYIFDGKKKSPYKEFDDANPINYYGQTKLKGENQILNLNLKNSIIIRTSWLYSFSENNFVSNIISNLKTKDSIKVVDDKFGSPTNAIDLACLILNIIPKLNFIESTKIFHFSNSGFCSRFQLAVKINSIIKSKCKIIPITSIELKTKRPNFSALDSTMIEKDYGISILNWEKRLENHLNYKNYVNEF